MQRLRTQKDVLQARLKVALAQVEVTQGGGGGRAGRGATAIRHVALGVGLAAIAAILAFNWATRDFQIRPDADSDSLVIPLELDHSPTKTWSKLSADGRTMVLYDAGDPGYNNREFPNPKLSVWDLRQGRELRKLEDPPAGWPAGGLSRDGTRFAMHTAAKDGPEFKLWDVTTGKLLGAWKDTEGSDAQVVLSRDGSRAYASGTFGEEVVVLNLNQQTLASVKCPVRHDRLTLAVPPDGGLLVSSGEFVNEVRNRPDLETLVQKDLRGKLFLYDGPDLKGKPKTLPVVHRLLSLGFSRDGRLLAGGAPGWLHVYRTRDWTEVKQVRLDGVPKHVEFTSDGLRVVVQMGKAVSVCNLESKTIERTVKADDFQITPNDVLVLNSEGVLSFVEAATGTTLILPGL